MIAFRKAVGGLAPLDKWAWNRFMSMKESASFTSRSVARTPWAPALRNAVAR